MNIVYAVLAAILGTALVIAADMGLKTFDERSVLQKMR